jgi:AraC-like DNA-binding protein
VFLIGTLFEIIPFSSFLNFGDGVKNSWEKEYGTAPYSHAELSSIDKFSQKLGYDTQKVKKVLESKNIKFRSSQSLLQISKDNNVSPQFIYNILKEQLDKEGKIIPLTGLGKKTVKEVAQTLNISAKEFKNKLKTLGINSVEEDRKFKEVLEEYDMSPMDVMEKLGYKKAK